MADNDEVYVKPIKQFNDPVRDTTMDDSVSLRFTRRALLEFRDEFLDPVTFVQLFNPVVTSDGQTYDKKSLEQYWNATGNYISPLTGKQVNDATYNCYKLKNLMMFFIEHSDLFDDEINNMPRDDAEKIIDHIIHLKKFQELFFKTITINFLFNRIAESQSICTYLSMIADNPRLTDSVNLNEPFTTVNSRYSLLMSAIRKHNDSALKLIQNRNVNINYCDDKNHTAFIISVRLSINNNVIHPTVDALLQRPDLNVSHAYSEEYQAFDIAYNQGKADLCIKIVSHPSFRYSAQKLFNIVIGTNNTLFRNKLIESNQFNMSICDNNNDNILHHASYCRYDDPICDVILNNNSIDINKKNKNNFTPFDAAFNMDNIELYDKIAQHRKFDPIASQMKLITMIINRNDMDMAKKFLPVIVSSNETINQISHDQCLIHVACKSYSKMPYVLQQLVSNKNINVNVFDRHDKTPLLYASMYDDPDCLDELLKVNTIDVNLASKTTRTSAFMISSMNNKHRIVQRLLQIPTIDINQTDNNGITPLMKVYRYGYLNIFDMILNHPNSTVNVFDTNGNTLLNTALDRSYADSRIEQIINHRTFQISDYVSATATKLISVLCQNFVAVDKIIEIANQYKHSQIDVLSLACQHLHIELIKKLITNPETQTINDALFTILQYSSKCLVNPNFATLLPSFFKHPKYVSNKHYDQNEETLLHHACNCRDKRMIDAILENDPNVNVLALTKNNESPLDFLCHKISSDDFDVDVVISMLMDRMPLEVKTEQAKKMKAESDIYFTDNNYTQNTKNIIQRYYNKHPQHMHYLKDYTFGKIFGIANDVINKLSDESIKNKAKNEINQKFSKIEKDNIDMYVDTLAHITDSYSIIFTKMAHDYIRTVTIKPAKPK